MSNIKPTILIRHKKENLKKCSLRGLETREDLLFFPYPIKDLIPLDGYLLLSMEGCELSEKDQDCGLLFFRWDLEICKADGKGNRGNRKAGKRDPFLLVSALPIRGDRLPAMTPIVVWLQWRRFSLPIFLPGGTRRACSITTTGRNNFFFLIGNLFYVRVCFSMNTLSHLAKELISFIREDCKAKKGGFLFDLPVEKKIEREEIIAEPEEKIVPKKEKSFLPFFL